MKESATHEQTSVPFGSSPRLDREWRTVLAMIRLYCRGRHGSADGPLGGERGGEHGLCSACSKLAAFARFRLEKCPFEDDKPTCAKCAIHCYRARVEEREHMKEVMRYSGPRMIFHHPLLALGHMLDGRRASAAAKRLQRRRNTSSRFVLSRSQAS